MKLRNSLGARGCLVLMSLVALISASSCGGQSHTGSSDLCSVMCSEIVPKQSCPNQYDLATCETGCRQSIGQVPVSPTCSTQAEALAACDQAHMQCNAAGYAQTDDSACPSQLNAFLSCEGLPLASPGTGGAAGTKGAGGASAGSGGSVTMPTANRCQTCNSQCDSCVQNASGLGISAGYCSDSCDCSYACAKYPSGNGGAGSAGTGGQATLGGSRDGGVATGDAAGETGADACSPGTLTCTDNAPQECSSSGTLLPPQPACGGATPVCSAGACIACPGTGGPAMVGLPSGYCMDSTEVTRGQYLAWLSTTPSTAGQVPGCSANDFTPQGDWPPTTNLDNPVAYVDWCDAYAYCVAVGKRLCGRIGGGASAFADFANPARSQWYAACTSGGSWDFPYGSTYSSSACNGKDSRIGAPLAVGTMTTCQSAVPGYAGIYDLSGNLSEWEDSCDGATLANSCRVRGGNYMNVETVLICNSNFNLARSKANQTIGFRCCSP